MLTDQEIFTRVSAHLLAQNRASMGVDADGEDVCAYRGDNGTKCAVGALIRDELYDPLIEGAGVDGVRAYLLNAEENPYIGRNAARLIMLAKALEDSGVDVRSATTMQLLGDLQHMHDDRNPKEWPELLHELAEEYGLQS